MRLDLVDHTGANMLCALILACGAQEAEIAAVYRRLYGTLPAETPALMLVQIRAVIAAYRAERATG